MVLPVVVSTMVNDSPAPPSGAPAVAVSVTAALGAGEVVDAANVSVTAGQVILTGAVVICTFPAIVAS